MTKFRKADGFRACYPIITIIINVLGGGGAISE
jgi:hypothetical protein